MTLSRQALQSVRLKLSFFFAIIIIIIVIVAAIIIMIIIIEFLTSQLWLEIFTYPGT